MEDKRNQKVSELMELVNNISNMDRLEVLLYWAHQYQDKEPAIG